jgi:hypothetical protein
MASFSGHASRHAPQCWKQCRPATGHARTVEHPLEGRLCVGVGLGAGLEQAAVLGALERLHGDHAHVLRRGAVDDRGEAGPGAVVVGEHHHVEASVVDRGAGDRLQVGRVRREAEKAHLALLLEPLERLVCIRVEQALERVDHVDVHEVDVVGLEALKALLDHLHVLAHARAGRQVTPGRAELGRHEHLVPAALHRATERHLGVRLRVVRSRVEVVDAAIDRRAGHLLPASIDADARRAERDVRHPGLGAPQAAVLHDSRALPLRAWVRILLGRLDPDVGQRDGQPAVVPPDHRDGARCHSAEAHRGAEQEATPAEPGRGLGPVTAPAARPDHRQDERDDQDERGQDERSRRDQGGVDALEPDGQPAPIPEPDEKDRRGPCREDPPPGEPSRAPFAGIRHGRHSDLPSLTRRL